MAPGPWAGSFRVTETNRASGVTGRSRRRISTALVISSSIQGIERMAGPGRAGAVSGSQAAVIFVPRVLARYHWAFPPAYRTASDGGIPALS